jgi:hypothetical protein
MVYKPKRALLMYPFILECLPYKDYIRCYANKYSLGRISWPRRENGS